MQFFLIGDAKAAEDLFSEVVALARDPNNAPLTRHQRHMYIRALQHVGMLRHDRAMVDEAIGLFHELVQEDIWTRIGQASI